MTTIVPIETAIEILEPLSIRSLDDYREFVYRRRLKRVGVNRGVLAQLETVDELYQHALKVRAIRIQAAPLEAHINAGRWVTPCPCGNGLPLHPEWQWAGCVECGRVWEAVTFPDAETLTAIDAVLAERPERPGHVIPHRFYSWTPDETIEDLEIENLKIAAAPQRAPRRRR